MHFHWDTAEEKQSKEKINNLYVAKKLVPYFVSYRKELLLAFCLLVISTGATLALPLILRKIIDQDIPEKSLAGLVNHALSYTGLFVVYIVTGFVQTFILSRMGLRIITKLKEDLFRHILGLDLDFFDENTPGKLLSRVESDAENLKQLFSNVVINIFRNIFTFGGIFIILFISEPKITIWITVLVPPLILGTYFFIYYVRRFYQKSRKIFAEMTGLLTEYIQGTSLIQLFNISSQTMNKIKDINLSRYNVELKANIINYGFFAAFAFVEILIVILIIVIGGKMVFAGKMTVGNFVMFIEFSRRIFQPIVEFSEYINMIQRAFVSANRTFNILDTKSKVIEKIGSIGPRKLEESIEFKNVSFSYDGKTRVVKGFNLKIPKGNKIAVVGQSGAGKSTLVNLFFRFFDPEEGEILFDGVNIREFSLNSWRKKIGLVLQDVYLFPGTISDNIRVLDDKIDDSKVKNASTIVRAAKFIERLPAGYGTELGERGLNISSGERQLVSFARAVSIDPEVLVLDEATSSVDNYTEKLIQQGIEAMLEDRTSLIIAHRLSTITTADKIIMMKNGEIIEEGTHQELLARGGEYFHMYQTQSLSQVDRERGRP